jgi:hypothetical protein
MVPVNSSLNSFEKKAWVMVKGNEGGIKFETPQAGLDSRNGGTPNTRIKEALRKNQLIS